jgi:hypothetical protein
METEKEEGYCEGDFIDLIMDLPLKWRVWSALNASLLYCVKNHHSKSLFLVKSLFKIWWDQMPRNTQTWQRSHTTLIWPIPVISLYYWHQIVHQFFFYFFFKSFLNILKIYFYFIDWCGSVNQSLNFLFF